MPTDCVIIANANTSTDERRNKSLTSNSPRAGLLTALDLLKRNRFNPLWLARHLRDRRKVQRVLAEQNSLLIEDRPRDWCSTEVINYVRAGRRVPEITVDNASRYITWFGDITLNGVILLDYLQRNGLSGDVIQTFGFESEEKVDRLLAEEPVCVIVSTTFITLDVLLALKEIFNRVTSLSPRSRVIVGSSMIHWYMSNHPEIIPVLLDCCHIIVDDAQGFETLVRVVRRLKRGEAIDSVPNIIFRRRGRACRTRREPEKIPLDELAPDWRRWLPRGYRGRVRVQTSQGCPFACRFCDFRLMNRTDYKSIGVLRDELRGLKSIGVSRLDFVDDLFTFPEDRLRSICRMMLDEQFGFSWFCLSRSAGLSAETIPLMAEAGCQMVNIGMESADPTVLQNMNKKTKVPEACRQIEAFHRSGVAVFSNFILGFPGETDRSIGRTIDFINSTAIDAYFLNPFLASRGTIIDKPRFRRQFSLKGEYLYWRHATGSSLELTGKIADFASRVDDSILRVGGLDEMQMLMDYGYTRADMRALAPVIKGLADWPRGRRLQPQDVEKSRDWLGQLARLESERLRAPETPELLPTGAGYRQ